MSVERHLVVFAKSPVLGRVKTRLGRDIGCVAATRFYRHNLSDILRRLNGGNWRCWLALSPDDAVDARRFWPANYSPLKQGHGDLGQRMDRAMRCLPPGPAVLIGADVPAIRPTHIKAAFKALGHQDAVFGPASDGGYWLVGMRRSPVMPDVFSDVRWSSRHTLNDSLDKLRRKAMKFALLDTLDDIDDGEAYRKWISK